MFFHPRFVYAPIITSAKRFLVTTNLASACTLVLLPFVCLISGAMPGRVRQVSPREEMML
jgi:hypothetical protein